MTTDYTQPQQYTPPQPAQPAQKKNSGCLKFFLIGCSVLVVLGVALCAVLVFFVFGAIKKSDVYKEALQKVQNDPRVVAALGTPIEDTFWVAGRLSVDNGKGTADFTFAVKGSKDKAAVHAIAAYDGRTWEFSTLDVTPGHAPPINVLTP
jgi:hypothetical protein